MTRRLATLGLLLLLSGCGGESVGQAPSAVLTAPSFCDLGATVTLDGTASTDPDGDIVRYEFIIADSTASRVLAGPTVEHTCHVTGLIEVALVVHDAEGNRGATRVTVSVRPP